MIDRRSVILLFFDLPMLSKNDRKEYSRFRKELKKNGYVSIQESVNIKLLHNSAQNKRELEKLKSFSPKTGSVYSIPICVSDFKKLASLSSEAFNFNLYVENTVYL